MPDKYNFTIKQDESQMDKHADVGNVAIQSGRLEIKCFINRYCPFVKTPKVQDAIVFDYHTLPYFVKFTPKDFMENVAVTPNTDGMHLQPKYVYRHNYLYYMKPEKYDEYVSGYNDKDFTNVELVSDANYFNEYFSEIDSPQGIFSGINETRYKKEQSWVMQRGFFTEEDENNKDALYNSLCGVNPVWKYRRFRVNNEGEEIDYLLDYNKYYYREFKEDIEHNDRQGICQISSNACNGKGVHWRLMKATPLFKGEDFFIEFHKQAKHSNLTKVSKESKGFSSDRWDFLDAILDPDYYGNQKYFENTGKKFPVNFAVSRPPNRESGKKWNNNYYLYDQAYYVVEIGAHGENGQHYYLLITERDHPYLIHVKDGISFPVNSNGNSKCPHVSGRQLIDADYFRMTVRSHLGKLVISFEGDGIDATPWVITREDIVPREGDDKDGNTHRKLDTKIVPMNIDRGHVYVSGGNILCGVLFGPLQYKTPNLQLKYPPNPGEAGIEEEQQYNLDDCKNVYTVDSSSPLPIPKYLTLPYGVNHKLFLSASEWDAGDISRYMVMPADYNRRDRGKLFVQDACVFDEYDESLGEDPVDRHPGTYLYGNPLKEFTSPALGMNTKDSYIGIKKIQTPVGSDCYDKRRQENFRMLVKMMAGDHVFAPDGTYYTGDSGRVLNDDELFVQRDIDPLNLADEEWILLDCKTPVMTTVRLVSEVDPYPRWNDETVSTSYNAETGEDSNSVAPYYPVPQLEEVDGYEKFINNEYAINASDHVLKYDDSWSADGFSNIEHTGNIEFLLGHNLNFTNDVSKDLYNLKDKQFYVEIWAGYQPHGNEIKTYTKREGFYKLFTGICDGASIEHKYSSVIMRCKIHDYTKVLKDRRFFNSPWFDGVVDINAINEILKEAGFRYEYPFDPGCLVDYISREILQASVDDILEDDNEEENDNEENFNNNEDRKLISWVDGRTVLYNRWALPSGYNRLMQHSWKFEDGDDFYRAINQIAERAGKLFYFDQFGVAHYEDYFDLVRLETIGKNIEDFPSFFKFTNLPTNFNLNTSTNSSLPTGGPGQLVFNKLDIAYDVASVFNHIKILSNTPDMTPIIRDDLNWDTLENPNSKGFIGYKKTFYQQEGMFGSEQNVEDVVNFYKTMFYPPHKINFETYGVPLRALDVVEINVDANTFSDEQDYIKEQEEIKDSEGDTDTFTKWVAQKYRARVMSVSHTLEPAENKWWMSVECERFQPLNTYTAKI